jgi:hypothetical protein
LVKSWLNFIHDKSSYDNRACICSTVYFCSLTKEEHSYVLYNEFAFTPVKSIEEALRAENEQLRMENAYLKMLNAYMAIVNHMGITKSRLQLES